MHFRKNLITYIIPCFILCMASGCDSDIIFEKNKEIAKHTWQLEDTITFVTNITDTTQFNKLYINVRNGGLYQYSNLFVFIDVLAPLGNQITDTLEITLADKTGKWYGKGLGDIKSISWPYKQNVRFGVPGIYKFRITHAMRTPDLNHIYDIGVRIEKSIPQKTNQK